MTWNIITDDGKKKTSELIKECKELFPVLTWQDLNDFDKDFPTPKEATTRTFAPTIEGDEDKKNKSYDDLKKKGVLDKQITLREYIIMCIQHFKKTGEHLDVEGWTLCAGSRSRDGAVPGGGGYDDELYFDWYGPDNANPDLRSREAVSVNLDPLPLESLSSVSDKNLATVKYALQEEYNRGRTDMYTEIFENIKKAIHVIPPKK